MTKDNQAGELMQIESETENNSLCRLFLLQDEKFLK